MRLEGWTRALAQTQRDCPRAIGSIHVAELHWYEAAGIGRKEFKIKQLL
jgi:hypothetical protein